MLTRIRSESYIWVSQTTGFPMQDIMTRMYDKNHRMSTKTRNKIMRKKCETVTGRHRATGRNSVMKILKRRRKMQR